MNFFKNNHLFFSNENVNENISVSSLAKKILRALRSNINEKQADIASVKLINEVVVSRVKEEHGKSMFRRNNSMPNLNRKRYLQKRNSQESENLSSKAVYSNSSNEYSPKCVVQTVSQNSFTSRMSSARRINKYCRTCTKSNNGCESDKKPLIQSTSTKSHKKAQNIHRTVSENLFSSKSNEDFEFNDMWLEDSIQINEDLELDFNDDCLNSSLGALIENEVMPESMESLNNVENSLNDLKDEIQQIETKILELLV